MDDTTVKVAVRYVVLAHITFVFIRKQLIIVNVDNNIIMWLTNDLLNYIV